MPQAKDARGRFTVTATPSNAYTAAFLAFVDLQKNHPEVLGVIEKLAGALPGTLDSGGPPPPSMAEVDPARAEPRKAAVRWKKTARGDARIWTATVGGHALRVERKKTAAGIVFDAYLDDAYQHRNKSSVTARDRLAYKLAKAESGASLH
jgi:hypothetical protein